MLGGGMAAGKSTVRNIIGQDTFWSKVRLLYVCEPPFAQMCVVGPLGVVRGAA